MDERNKGLRVDGSWFESLHAHLTSSYHAWATY